MSVKKCLATNVRHIRKSKQLSQMELAEQAGLSLNQISEMERALKWPRSETIEAIARALKVNPMEFFVDDGLVLARVKKALNEYKG